MQYRQVLIREDGCSFLGEPTGQLVVKWAGLHQCGDLVLKDLNMLELTLEDIFFGIIDEPFLLIGYLIITSAPCFTLD